MHACKHTSFADACIQVHTHSQTHTGAGVHDHTFMHACMYMPIHACMHERTHAQAHMQAGAASRSPPSRALSLFCAESHCLASRLNGVCRLSFTTLEAALLLSSCTLSAPQPAGRAWRLLCTQLFVASRQRLCTRTDQWMVCTHAQRG